MFKKFFCVSALLTTMFITNATAEEEAGPWSVDADVGFYTDYMWRGFNLFEGTSIQPSLTASYATDIGTFSGNLWMHIPAEPGSRDDKFTEIDETLSYSYTWDKVTLDVGAIWYTYPDNSDDLDTSAEFYGSIAYDDSEWNTILPLSPSFTAYHDYMEFDNQYYEIGLSHEFLVPALGDGFNITPYVAFGFASNAEKAYASNGFVQATYGASFNATLGDITVSPSLNVTNEADDNAVNQFWVGTSFLYSF
jgi:hypothetical protein